MGRLRTSSTILKMTLQHTMLRLHLIAFFYSRLTPWYYFSKRVLRIVSTAFFVYGGCVNFFFHSTILNDSLRSSSFHISCLRRLNFRHSISMCQTVCEVWPQPNRSLSTIFPLYGNEGSPIVGGCAFKWDTAHHVMIYVFEKGHFWAWTKG